MFENIGGKIKGLAVIIFIIEAIAFILGGIVCMMIDDELILIGLLTMIGGFIIAWISSWFMYGFGELIEKTCQIEYNTRCRADNSNKIYSDSFPKTTVTENLNNISSRSRGYVCPKCKMENDSMKPCERCGYIPQ